MAQAQSGRALIEGEKMRICKLVVRTEKTRLVRYHISTMCHTGSGRVSIPERLQISEAPRQQIEAI